MPTNVVEIMSSIQGEGMVVGQRQLFIRFAGCNLNCKYCDTQTAINYAEPCQIERTPGQRDFVYVNNPLTVEQLVGLVSRFDLRPLHSISLTGGEPLLHVEYLQELLPRLQALGPQLYLETNGTLVDNLACVLAWLDIISMDIKLASCSQEPMRWSEHMEFLKLANQKQAFVKLVISANTTEAEVREAAGLVAKVGKEIPLIIQPVTPTAGILAPEPAQVIRFQDLCLQALREVRVIPQTHKFINQL